MSNKVYIAWALLENGEMDYQVFDNISGAQMFIYQHFISYCYKNRVKGEALYNGWASILSDFEIPNFGWIDIVEPKTGPELKFSFIIDP